jgi:hypothetical protein
VESYFGSIGYPIAANTNPAEFLLDIVSSDFNSSKELAVERVSTIQTAWQESDEANAVTRQVSERVSSTEKPVNKEFTGEMAQASVVAVTSALLHRSFIKSYRDVVAYGIRIVMYLGTLHCPFLKVYRG